MAEIEPPILTQKLTIHLNGGSKFSTLCYEVYADGEPTGIIHRRMTNGSPKYLITEDVFLCGDESFDILATKGEGWKAWIRAHLKAQSEGED